MILSRIAFSTFVLTGLAGTASAAYVTATYTGVTPGVAVTITDTTNSQSLGTLAGGFNFSRVGGTATDPYLSGNYVAFCIDIFKTVGPGPTYGWNQTALPNAPTPSGNTNYPMGAIKAGLLGKLWGAHRNGLSGDVMFGAFQLAVWEIVFENSNTLDIDSGTFFATGGNVDSASARSLANTWLGTLGSDPVYGGVYALTGNTGDPNDGSPQDQLVPTPGGIALCCVGGLVFLRRRR